MESKRGINPDCFFCHKSFGKDSSVNVFNLRQLFRYLKIKLKLDQNSVLLCSQCNTLGCQLYQQIMELEVTKMKINYSLERLVTKISKVSGGGADGLQNLVKEKCISRLSNVKYPQVKLKRLPQVRIVIPIAEDHFVSPISSPSSAAPPSSFGPEPEETIVKIEVNEEIDNQPITISKFPKPKSRKSSKNVKPFSLCDKSQRSSEECYSHEAENHPDKLLLEAKLDYITESQFLQICEQVLARHKVIPSSLQNKPKRYGCVYCQNLYGKMNFLKQHTIQSHFPTLIQKVRQLQSQGSTTDNVNDNDVPTGQLRRSCDFVRGPVSLNSENLRKLVATSAKSNLDNSKPPLTYDNIQNPVDMEDNYPLINASFSQVKTQNLSLVHTLISEPEIEAMSPVSLPASPAAPSPPSPEPEVSNVKMEVDEGESSQILKSKAKPKRKQPPNIAKACKFCPKILTNDRLYQFHQSSHHPDKLLLEAKLDSTSDSLFLEICQNLLTRHKVVQNKVGCLYCSNSFAQRKCLKRHTIESHRRNTIEKLRQLQRIVVQNPPTTDNAYLCQYCNKVLTSEGGLMKHKRILCETLGELVVIPDEKVTHVISHTKPSIPRKRCKFCPKTFGAPSSLLLHSTTVHYIRYLNAAKLENVIDEQFEVYCQDLLISHFPIRFVLGKRIKYTKCEYCGESCHDLAKYKSHLIIKHIDILFDKVKELQKEPPKLKIHIDPQGHKKYKRACPNCGKWFARYELVAHMKNGCKCKKRIKRKCLKLCKCGKRFYSLDDLNKHSCPGRKTRKQPSKHPGQLGIKTTRPDAKQPVQCDKCGTQVKYSLKKHQSSQACRFVYEKTFVKKNMTDILAKMSTQISPLLKINQETAGSSNYSSTSNNAKIDGGESENNVTA